MSQRIDFRAKNLLLMSKEPSSLVDNKLKNTYKMFVIFKTSNKNFVLNKWYVLTNKLATT